MTVEELIQLIRTCNLSQVRAELERRRMLDPAAYQQVIWFYAAAAKQPKQPK